MKITTLIPLSDSFGQPTDEDAIDRILDQIATTFGGCSMDGVVNGRSIDNGKLQRDRSYKVSFDCDLDRILEAKDMVIRIGRELKQFSMYFDIRDCEGTSILPVSDDSAER